MRRLLLGPARLGRALLLGVLSFEGATRTITAWDCLLDADLQLLNAHYGTTRTRDEWFSYMITLSTEQWAAYADAVLPATARHPTMCVSCPDCPAFFDTTADMVRHRSVVHGIPDAAVEYWRTHRGEYNMILTRFGCEDCSRLIRSHSGSSCARSAPLRTQF